MSRRAGRWVLYALTLASGVLLSLAARDDHGALGLARPAHALPLYTARSGRTCDNCHVDPTPWKNPRLARRKCTLSCAGCHINPTGGGMRTVSGRFYAQTTLPIFYASHRGYKDWDRHLLAAFAGTERVRRNRLPDPAWGTPLGGSAPMAFDQDRYAGLNADALVQVGVDMRLATWIAADARVFPMQLDVAAALHPVRYLTAHVGAGVLAKSQGFAGTFEHRTPFGLKDVFLMLHQLDYLGYLRVGRFLPPFGTALDDHTSPIRRDFELDFGLLESRVTGVEIGLAPNYPYLNVALFRPGPKDLLPADDPYNAEHPSLLGVAGWGVAASAGWRDLGWQAGASAMVRRRDLVDGGDTESLSVQWGFNPWFYLDWLPLTYLGELALGRRQRDFSSTRTTQLALYQELDLLAFNGINLQLKHDYSEPDAEVRDDHYHRFTVGAELYPLPSTSLRVQLRIYAGAGPGSTVAPDALIYLRAFY